MYGGKTRNDSLAMKSGNHELKGLIAYMGSEIKVCLVSFVLFFSQCYC